MAIQRIRVDVAMLDGTEYNNLVVVTADRMRLAATARRHQWGTLQDDPDRSVTFLAWCAMARLGHFTGTWDDFVLASETVTSPDVDDEVDPTRQATPVV